MFTYPHLAILLAIFVCQTYLTHSQFKMWGLIAPSANGPSWGRTRRQGRAGVWQAAGGWEGMWLFIWRGWAVPPGEFRRSEASEAVREV